MRIFTNGETPPDIPKQDEQPPLSFELSFEAETSEEVLVNKNKFPLVEDFELVIIDGRQNPPEKPLGSDVMAQFINRATNRLITYWDMYYIDVHGPERSLPIPSDGQLILEPEAGYLILIAADEEFVYVAYSEDETAEIPVYTRYCKIPRSNYEAEWQAFVDWYHVHPEKRHPHPTPAERQANSARSDDGSLKRSNWFSRLFK